MPNSQAVGSTFIVSSEGGVPKPIGADLPSAAYPVWSSDSKYLTVLVDRDRIDQDWWIIPVQGGNAVQTHAFERLKKLGMTISYGMEPPKISSWIGSTVLFSAKFGDAVNVWKARFTLPNGALENVQRETSGTNLEVDAAYTSDGNLSFASILRDVSIYSLSGNTNTASFAELSRITKGSGDHLTPSLSRDGQILAYSCGKTSSICLKDLTTGKESTLTDGPHSRPKISNDNKTIAYAMIGGDSIPLFTMPITGGPSEKIAYDGGWAFGWSRNDRNLVFSKAHNRYLFRGCGYS